ncbi:MAG: hypothetical protein ACRDR6_22890, partial [Pseudonocardiaceae bacterium]
MPAAVVLRKIMPTLLGFVTPSRTPYPGDVIAAHAFELPPHSAAPAEAVDAAVDSRVVYLTHNGEPVAAIVPADVAAAGAAAIEALENAEDIRAARAARADHG